MVGRRGAAEELVVDLGVRSAAPSPSRGSGSATRAASARGPWKVNASARRRHQPLLAGRRPSRRRPRRPSRSGRRRGSRCSRRRGAPDARPRRARARSAAHVVAHRGRGVGHARQDGADRRGRRSAAQPLGDAGPGRPAPRKPKSIISTSTPICRAVAAQPSPKRPLTSDQRLVARARGCWRSTPPRRRGRCRCRSRPCPRSAPPA